MKQQHENHLSVAIVTSPYGCCGGSLFAWETYSACRRFDIAAILATFDPRHHYPEIGQDLRMIAGPGLDVLSTGASLIDVVAEARSCHKFLIVDLPAGFGEDETIKAALKDSGIAESSTIAGLIPVMPGQPGTWAAALGVGAFEDTKIRFDYGLFRFWDSERGLCRPDFPVLPNFPFWVASTLTQRAIAAIHGKRRRDAETVEGWLPGLCLAGPSQSDPIPDTWVAREVSEHLEDATSAIYDAILAPHILPCVAA